MQCGGAAVQLALEAAGCGEGKALGGRRRIEVVETVAGFCASGDRRCWREARRRRCRGLLISTRIFTLCRLVLVSREDALYGEGALGATSTLLLLHRGGL